MKNLAIITARGQSKRIPRKNIKIFNGKPMIFYAINSAIESRIFDEIMVSTDDEEIAKISKKLGAKIPFMRSAKNSDDFATTIDVLKEVISDYKKLGIYFENLCCIYPCVPFLNGKILKDAFLKFNDSKADSLISIVAFDYPVQRSLKLNGEFLEFINPEFKNTRSQDLEKIYHDAGMFYFHKTDKLNSEQKIGFEIDSNLAQDIDTLKDWQKAELKFRIAQCK